MPKQPKQVALHNCKKHPFAPFLREEKKCFGCWSISRGEGLAALRNTAARTSYFQPAELRDRAHKMFQRGVPKTTDEQQFAEDMRMLKE